MLPVDILACPHKYRNRRFDGKLLQSHAWNPSNCFNSSFCLHSSYTPSSSAKMQQCHKFYFFFLVSCIPYPRITWRKALRRLYASMYFAMVACFPFGSPPASLASPSAAI